MNEAQTRSRDRVIELPFRETIAWPCCHFPPVQRQGVTAIREVTGPRVIEALSSPDIVLSVLLIGPRITLLVDLPGMRFASLVPLASGSPGLFFAKSIQIQYLNLQLLYLTRKGSATAILPKSQIAPDSPCAKSRQAELWLFLANPSLLMLVVAIVSHVLYSRLVKQLDRPCIAGSFTSAPIWSFRRGTTQVPDLRARCPTLG